MAHQLGLPLFWTEGRRRGFGLADLNRLMACNTARLAGLDNRKGRIERGFDADFVLWDPEEEFVVRREDIRHRNKLTPYIGKRLTGVVKRTVVR